MADDAGEASLAEWLEARLVDVDPQLASRVRDAVGPLDRSTTMKDASSILVRAATARLAPLAAEGHAGRETAVELLAVDTLATLACEALADVGDEMSSIVDETTAMVREIASAMPELDGAA